MRSGIGTVLAGLAGLAVVGQAQDPARPPPLSLTPVPPPLLLPPPPLPTIVSPVWVRRPAPEYPDAALTADIPVARVLLECDVRADGTIPDCVVTEETPPGYGFGEAARAAAIDGVVQPWVENGVALEARAWVSIRFVLEEEPEPDLKADPKAAARMKRSSPPDPDAPGP